MRIIYTVVILTLTFSVLALANVPNPSIQMMGQVKNAHIFPIKQNNPQLGQLKNVEDVGYPLVILTVEHAEGGTGTYELNLEAVENIDSKKINSWIGQEVAFEFGTETINALLDLKRDGKSIIDSNGFKPHPETKKIKGILSNAEHITTSDLPDNLLITTLEEITESFPFFITKKIAAANGKNVVAFYEKSTKNVITHIQLSKN